MSDYKNLSEELPQESGDFKGRVIYKEDPERKWVLLYMTIDVDSEDLIVSDALTGKNLLKVAEEIEWLN